jgi:hypothetical protein
VLHGDNQSIFSLLDVKDNLVAINKRWPQLLVKRHVPSIIKALAGNWFVPLGARNALSEVG